MHSISPTASCVGRQEKNETQIVNQAGPLPESVTRNATPAASQEKKVQENVSVLMLIYRKPEGMTQLSPRPRHASTISNAHKHTTHSRAPGLEGKLDGVLAGPLPGSRLILRPVRLVHVCNLGNQRVVGVGVGQHRADGEQDCSRLILTVAGFDVSSRAMLAYLWRWSGLGTTGLAECPSRCFHCC